jgi:chloramphenicol 3-O-phosphotransferase
MSREGPLAAGEPAPRDARADARDAAGFAEGDAVEGNFEGNGEWFPGRVSAAHADGTYDIDYDDGDRESRVAASRVRAAAAGGGGDDGPLAEGDAVEGNYAGNGEWFPGRVSAAHADGTYDIDYDDGDRESRVARGLLRRAASG